MPVQNLTHPGEHIVDETLSEVRAERRAPNKKTVAAMRELHEPTPAFRIDLQASEANGLKKPSQIMLDKIQTAPRTKVGQVLGALTLAEMEHVNQARTAVGGPHTYTRFTRALMPQRTL